MKRLLSLIKASFTEGMSIFKIRNKSDNKKTKILLPVFLVVMLFISVYGYAQQLIIELARTNLESVLIILFVVITFLLTFIEGIYKSGDLLFNSKDDDLLLSLPINKRTVLFIRLFKFYVFELLFNSLFLLPAIVCYVVNVPVNLSFYFVSLIMILLLPVIPIIMSSLIGVITTSLSTKFKYKNLVQIIISFILLLVILYFSFNTENIVNGLVSNANNIKNIICKYYYPADVYIKMITNFNILDLLIFIIISIGLVILFVIVFSKGYFLVNSKNKIVRKNKVGKVNNKKNSVIISLIKKEVIKFINTPVFVINAGFGLILFIFMVIGLVLKFDLIVGALNKMDISINIYNYIPCLLYALIGFSSYMTSITSSMISLEGKSFSILKSLPVSPFTIILSKVYSAVLIMIPFILLGDLITFISFKFNVLEILLILIASIIFPLISELIGILVNLKYPNMDAENDTEIVKQSMSSMVAVFIGMFLAMICFSFVSLGIYLKFSSLLLIIINLIISLLLLVILLLILKKNGDKLFNKIN